MFDAAVADRSPPMVNSAPQVGPESDAPALFRQAMRRHAAGVCVLSAGQGERLNGMAVTAATSFSMDPPSVLVCVNEAASLAPQLVDGACFGLTVLGREHEEVAAAFGSKPSGPARFRHADWRRPGDDAPWLEGAPANLSCIVERRLTYGSHTAVIGRVTAVRLGPDAPSLVFRDGVYA
jgi:flavin reductase (DIM6/NTAB) family NADH-FMN oxidoreductase RutF